MANLDIQFIKKKNWPKLAARIISDSIINIIKGGRKCNVMLTGGRSAEMLYAAWSELPDFKLLNNVHFYFSDERCVPRLHSQSNYALVMRTLFRNGIPPGCRLVQMELNPADLGRSAQLYEEKLPSYLDVTLLSAGDDGHLASIFPGAESLSEVKRRVISASSPYHPHDRLTISPLVFKNMEKIFVLAFGKKKASILHKFQLNYDEFCRLPVGLAIGATWLTDMD